MVIVGLPETAVKESKDRVKTAIINAGYSLPNKRLTVNLSPADLPKSGGRYDLVIALYILVAASNLPEGCLRDFEFLGELALNGEIRFVSGILPATIQTSSTKRSLIVPAANGPEAALVETSLQVFAASSDRTPSGVYTASFSERAKHRNTPRRHNETFRCSRSETRKTSTHYCGRGFAQSAFHWPAGQWQNNAGKSFGFFASSNVDRRISIFGISPVCF